MSERRLDPRGLRQHQSPNSRSLDDSDRATYDENNVPANGNRRGHRGDDNGALSNDLETGGGGQDWKGW